MSVGELREQGSRARGTEEIAADEGHVSIVGVAATRLQAALPLELRALTCHMSPEFSREGRNHNFYMKCPNF